jgi:uncharacterized membrane protein
LWAGGLAWAVGFSILAADRHEGFMSHRFDLGNMVQAVWNTAHGRFLEMTMTDGEQLNRLGAHVDPFLAALAPVWWLWPSPLLLTTVQAVALATGALPVYWLARKHTGDGRCGLFLAFAYLLFPAVQWNALNDFHPVTVAIPLLLFCVWFLDEDRPLMGALFAILAATTKEDIPLVVAGIAVWYVVRHRRWLVGGALALLGLGWALVDLYVVIPHYSGGPSPFYDRLGSVGGSPTGVVTTLVTHPLRVWDAMTTGDDLRYLGLLLVPLLFLWALEPVLALAATPVLVVSLLSDFGPMTSIRYQSVAVPVACLFAASAIGVGRLGSRAALLMSGAVFMVALVATWGGPLGSLDTYGGTDQPSPARVSAIRRAIALIPAAVPVSASNEIGAHLSERRRIFRFPVYREADWVIIDSSDRSETATPLRLAPGLSAMRRDRRWRQIFRQDGVYVFAKRRA